ACPAPGDIRYVLGLNQGDSCIQLLVQDGGLNDADGLANATIVDPSGLAEFVGPDDDRDGVADAEDNCLFASNPDQRDSNSDGYGNRCDGDLNNDGSTNTLDLNQYKLAHRSSLGDANYTADADFNGDEAINTLDLNIYRDLHRKDPGPSCCGQF
ncbi:MAG: thrombospondin type 3 repeat-containing protein, partial [Gammaproteobacteria bacterium]